MPDPLRIKPNGIQPHQAAVYEDFGKTFRRITTIDMNNRISDPSRRSESRPASVSSFNAAALYRPASSLDRPLNQNLHSHQEAMERFLVSPYLISLKLLLMLFRSLLVTWKQ
jgi:CCR4-NOT transcription complex subunit 1